MFGRKKLEAEILELKSLAIAQDETIRRSMDILNSALKVVADLNGKYTVQQKEINGLRSQLEDVRNEKTV